MKLPEINNRSINELLDTAEIVQQTAEQIMKDFGMFGVEITYSGNTGGAYNELHSQLVAQITALMERRSELLWSVLYQVDISDRAIRKAEEELPHYTYIEVIAHEVIARELKKVLLRRYFKQQDEAKKDRNTDALE